MLNGFYLTTGSHLQLPIVASAVAGDVGFPVVSATYLNWTVANREEQEREERRAGERGRERRREREDRVLPEENATSEETWAVALANAAPHRREGAAPGLLDLDLCLTQALKEGEKDSVCEFTRTVSDTLSEMGFSHT